MNLERCRSLITVVLFSASILLIWLGMYFACHDPYSFQPIGIVAALTGLLSVILALHFWEHAPDKKER